MFPGNQEPRSRSTCSQGPHIHGVHSLSSVSPGWADLTVPLVFPHSTALRTLPHRKQLLSLRCYQSSESKECYLRDVLFQNNEKNDPILWTSPNVLPEEDKTAKQCVCPPTYPNTVLGSRPRLSVREVDAPAVKCVLQAPSIPSWLSGLPGDE